MKKLVLIAVLLLVPFTAFALDSMNDSALDEMTAQQGVTITFDGVVVTQGVSDFSWGDGDGLGGTTAAGYLFLEESGAGTTVSLDGTSMTIDVATAGVGGYIVVPDGPDADTDPDLAIAEGTTFVAIGLPSVTVGAAAKTTTVSLISAAPTAATVPTAAQTLGSFYQNTTGNTTIVGSVYIYPHVN
ncbi:MAG: hypothetical protein KKD44_22880 [Proteobacteria bacterium]|nr:hypothetical protein [Pseudomonadota bacterium]